MNTPKFEILTVRTVYSIGDTDEERLALIEEQNSKLKSLGYDLNDVYVAHFFNSVFFNEQTESDTIDELLQRLATKDGIDLVRFENGKIGFVAYYNGETNGFEIIGNYKEIKEEVSEYIKDIEQNYKQDFITMWETCCDLCGWIDLDNPNTAEMVDIVMDYNNSLFDDGLRKILRGGETE
ncbi:MAG: hypothetical protein J6S49_08010 [Erysipelotrichaceae bacterium]|nr:hypothetical protein [Erysipelotrichaceae bacterium]